jgi:hypothetical protein
MQFEKANSFELKIGKLLVGQINLIAAADTAIFVHFTPALGL